MLQNFKFVEEGVLAGCARPEGSVEDVVAAVKGFRTVVTLLEEPLPSAQAISASGINYVHIPIVDFAAPTMDDMERIGDLAVDEKNLPILVHCRAGIGRTGTMLAAAVSARYPRMTTQSVLQYVRALRPGSLEVPAQEQALDQFVALVKARRNSPKPRKLSQGEGVKRPHTGAEVLAAAVEQMGGHLVDVKSDCPHCDKVADLRSFSFDINDPCGFANEDGTKCANTGENMQCLVCYAVMCGRHVKGHMVKHFEATQHPIVVGFEDMSFWCYLCNDYITHQNKHLFPYYKNLHMIKHGCFPPSHTIPHKE